MPKVRRQKHIGRRDASGDPGRRPRSLTSVTSTEPPLRNPQATLLGLPAELRLLIYEFYLRDSLIHLHPRPIHCKENESPKFIWRACRATDPRSALLCKNPTWSATCGGKDRCHTKKLNTFPILIVCKAIYYEIKGIRGSIFSRVAVSLNAHDWTTFIEQSPKSLLANLRRLTLCGFHSYGLNLYMDNRSSPLAKIFYNIPKILPQLEEIGFQGKILESVIGTYDPRKKGYNIAGRQQFRDWDLFRCCFSKYNPNITVVFYGEAMLSDKGNGEIGKCVVIRKGKEDGVLDGTVGCTWDDGDVEVWEEQVLVLDEKSREFWGTWEMHDLYWRKGGRCKCV